MLFLSPVVQAGWEKESNITDFELLGDLGAGNLNYFQRVITNGIGAFGNVKKMRHIGSNITYAIKLMSKSMLKNNVMIEQIKTEIKIMYGLNHENIIQLYNHFEDDNVVCLVIEYAPGVIKFIN